MAVVSEDVFRGQICNLASASPFWHVLKCFQHPPSPFQNGVSGTHLPYTHTIHVWYIYLHEWLIFEVNIYLHLPQKLTIHVGKYTSPMDAKGHLIFKICCSKPGRIIQELWGCWKSILQTVVANIWVFPKIGYPKMDGEKIGKPYLLMDDLGGNTLIFGNAHLLKPSSLLWISGVSLPPPLSKNCKNSEEPRSEKVCLLR